MGDADRNRRREPSTLEGSEQASPRRKVDALLGWARKYSLFAYPFVTACCGMEFMALTSPRFDLARFGAEAPRFSPRQSDLLWVVGTISQRQAPVLKRIYEQMMEPKWVLAFGTCASCGGFYDNYTTVPGIDKIIPVRRLHPRAARRGPRPCSTGSCSCRTRSPRNERRPAIVKPRSTRPQAVGPRAATPLGQGPDELPHQRRAESRRREQVSQLVLDKLKETFGAAVLETHSRLRRRHRGGRAGAVEGGRQVPPRATRRSTSTCRSTSAASTTRTRDAADGGRPAPLLDRRSATASA